MDVAQVSGLTIQLANSKKNLVQNIHFNLTPGKITAVIGESGSGKTITTTALIGLLPKSLLASGFVGYSFIEEGKENVLHFTNTLFNNQVRGIKIGSVFQDPMAALNPLLTVQKQLFESLQTHTQLSNKTIYGRIKELLEQVGIHDIENTLKKYPHQLSGGQQQRIVIAMALSCNPSILIADEPTTALDVTIQHQILALIKKLSAQYGLATLFISHDLLLVKKIADYILVMRNGCIVEHNNAEAIFTSAQHPYTKALLQARPTTKNKNYFLPTVQEISSETFSPTSLPEIPLTNDPLFTMENITVQYKKNKQIFKALNHINTTICKNEILGIIGESGSGKTTFAKVLLGLLPISNGSLQYYGTNKKGNKQMVFQNPFASLNPKQSIIDILTEPLLQLKIISNRLQARSKAVDLLEAVGLSENDLYKYPHQFSGGQKQRISIARALASSPEFIVFDESVSALDVSVQAQILNLIQQLRSTYNFTAVFITHNLEVAYYISDRILVMNQGNIVETGTPEKLYTKPQHEYTEALLKSVTL